MAGTELSPAHSIENPFSDTGEDPTAEEIDDWVDADDDIAFDPPSPPLDASNTSRPVPAATLASQNFQATAAEAGITCQGVLADTPASPTAAHAPSSDVVAPTGSTIVSPPKVPVEDSTSVPAAIAEVPAALAALADDVLGAIDAAVTQAPHVATVPPADAAPPLPPPPPPVTPVMDAPPSFSSLVPVPAPVPLPDTITEGAANSTESADRAINASTLVPPAAPAPEHMERYGTTDAADVLAAEEERRRGAGGWGWGAGWMHVPKILKDVAAGAAHDIRELTDTFQAALAEVAEVAVPAPESDPAGGGDSKTGRHSDGGGSRGLVRGASGQARAFSEGGAGGGHAKPTVGRVSKVQPSAAGGDDAADGAIERGDGGGSSAALNDDKPAGRADAVDEAELRDGGSASSADGWSAPGAGGERGGGGGGDGAGRRRGGDGRSEGAAVLQRLHEASEDTELAAGLKAVDDQVEQLATGAAKALSSLWGGLNSVAQGGWNLAAKVDAAAKNVARELAHSVEEVQQAETLQRLATQAESRLQSVGKSAISLLEDATGQFAGSERRHVVQAPHEPASFEDFFYVYGGAQLCEELEALSNESARMVNKSRSRLEAGQQQQLDAMLSKLGPIFSEPLLPTSASAAAPFGSGVTSGPRNPLYEDSSAASAPITHEVASAETESASQATEAAAAGNRSSVGDGGGGGDARAAAEKLQAMYAPVAYLRAECLAKATQFAELLEQASAASSSPPSLVGNTVAPPPAEGAGSNDTPPPAPPAALALSAVASDELAALMISDPAARSGSGSEPTADAKTPTAAAPTVAAAATGEESGTGPGAAAVAAVAALRPAKTQLAKRLAEMSTAQVQLLLLMGHSLAAPARMGHVLEDGVDWPAGGAAQAHLLRAEALRMVGDVRGVVDAYCTVVQGALAVAAEQGEPYSVVTWVRSAVALRDEIAAEGGTAEARASEGFRSLLYVVLLRSIVTEIA